MCESLYSRSPSLAGRTVELLMLRSLPRGDYLVSLFIGDRQGLSQKQTVHVRVCSCPGEATCAVEPLAAEPELLVGVLAPLCMVFLALAGRSVVQAVRQENGALWGGEQVMADAVGCQKNDLEPHRVLDSDQRWLTCSDRLSGKSSFYSMSSNL